VYKTLQMLLLANSSLSSWPIAQSKSISTLRQGGLLRDPAHEIQNRLKVPLLDAARVVVATGERFKDLDGCRGKLVQLLHVDRPGVC